MNSITLTEMIQKMGLTNLTPELDTDTIVIKTTEVNRPALQLTGFYEHFENERVQLVGNVERAYLDTLPEKKRKEVMEELVSHHIPCLVYTAGAVPPEYVVELCGYYDVPCLASTKSTSAIMAQIIRWLNIKLAPMISIHGVLVDVFGVGVLITGESGIGKSEAALELINRGHRLVSDDCVEIRKVSDVQLVGTSPAITKYFIELRGIGILDVKTLFGVECVKDEQTIDMVIKLEEWDRNKEYDRIGLDEQYTEDLGIKVGCHTIPIRPGRNLSIIVESAAVNHRQKRMGYNTAKELYRRLQANFAEND